MFVLFISRGTLSGKLSSVIGGLNTNFKLNIHSNTHYFNSFIGLIIIKLNDFVCSSRYAILKQVGAKTSIIRELLLIVLLGVD